MSEQKKSQKMKLNENQLLQMAQREEQVLREKQSIAHRIKQMLEETVLTKEILTEANKKEEKIMINIGATVLLEAKITNFSKCKRAINENAYKEETITETIKWLEGKENQIKERLISIQKEIIQHQNNMNNYINVLKQIETKKSELLQKARQEPPSLSK